MNATPDPWAGRAAEARDGFLARYRRTTRSSFAGPLKQFGTWCAADGLNVLDVTLRDLQAYEATLVKRGLADGTISAHQSAITNFLRFAAEEQYVSTNPAERWKRVRPTENPASSLSSAEFSLVLDAARQSSTRDLVVVCLLGMEGLRIAEVCNAQVRDLVSAPGGGLALVIKEGTHRRTVPLLPPTVEAIRSHLGSRRSGPLLRGREGGAFDRHAAARIVRRLSNNAGILQPVSPQVLTNTSISMLLEAGVPMKELQDALGRSDLRFLSRFSRKHVPTTVESKLRVWETFAGGAVETDLLRQADALLEEVPSHPAAPIMLAGAALEEFLRSLVAASGAVVHGRPSIASYSDALRVDSVLDAQDGRRVAVWAGLRNRAAHGDFAGLSLEDAAEMVAGIRRFTAKHRG